MSESASANSENSRSKSSDDSSALSNFNEPARGATNASLRSRLLDSPPRDLRDRERNKNAIPRIDNTAIASKGTTTCHERTLTPNTSNAPSSTDCPVVSTFWGLASAPSVAGSRGPLYLGRSVKCLENESSTCESSSVATGLATDSSDSGCSSGSPSEFFKLEPSAPWVGGGGSTSTPLPPSDSSNGFVELPAAASVFGDCCCLPSSVSDVCGLAKSANGF